MFQTCTICTIHFVHDSFKDNQSRKCQHVKTKICQNSIKSFFLELNKHILLRNVKHVQHVIYILYIYILYIYIIMYKMYITPPKANVLQEIFAGILAYKHFFFPFQAEVLASSKLFHLNTNLPLQSEKFQCGQTLQQLKISETEYFYTQKLNQINKFQFVLHYVYFFIQYCVIRGKFRNIQIKEIFDYYFLEKYLLNQRQIGLMLTQNFSSQINKLKTVAEFFNYGKKMAKNFNLMDTKLYG
eukprot:TRINITY_DN3604_c0_g1_i2.p1 TRINITY_DN3604_c0_g1~~TRINITY_DN3604_c0_g1_i2.p1  ORF type:complete len:242 (+),score=-9.15 TRINITY_DN3604_c0_g1_i2:245-970(+)